METPEVWMTLENGETVVYPKWARPLVHKYKGWRSQKGNFSERVGKKYIMYAVTTRNYKIVYMHKLIYPDIRYLEHIDGNGLNNMPDNVREVVPNKNADDPMQCIQWNPKKNNYYVRVIHPFTRKRVCKSFGVHKYSGSHEAAVKAAMKFRDAIKNSK